jgi:hypothetical protein
VEELLRSLVPAVAAASACALVLGLGCATVESIHRPPTRTEIQEINDGSRIVVELLQTAGPKARIDHVVSADAASILVAPVHGPPYALRVSEVTRFSVRRHPGDGLAIGASIGAGVGAAGLFFTAVLISGMGDSGSSPPGMAGSGPHAQPETSGFPV